MTVCKCCKLEPTIKNRSFCSNCYDLHLEKKEKYCNYCDKVLGWKYFSFSCTLTFNLSSTCRECYNKKRRKGKRPLVLKDDSFFKKMHHSCIGAIRYRKDKAKICLVDWVDIKNLYIKQNKKCYYTGIEMILARNSNFKISTERINPEIGYILSNIVLCCSEFNGICQFSKEKISEMIKLSNDDTRIRNFEKLIKNANTNDRIYNTPRTIEIKNINNTPHYKCNRCNYFLKSEKFYANKNKACKSCQAEMKIIYVSTIRGRLNTLLNSAKNSSKQRKTGLYANNRDNNMNIDFAYLLDLYEKQEGRCYYSNIKMSLAPKSDWLISLERLNPHLGYTTKNVALVCHEFNVFDCRVRKPEGELTEGCFFSKEKFQIFVDSIKKNKLY